MFSVRGGPYYTALTEQDDSSTTPATKGGLHDPPATLATHPGKGALFPCDQALDTHRKASLITPTTTSTTNTTTTTLTHITTTTSTNTINNNNLLHHHHNQHHNTSINNNTSGGGGGVSSSSNNSGSTPGLRYHSSSLDNSLLSSSNQARGTIAGSGGGSSAHKGGGSSSPLSLTSLKAAWKSLTSITSSSSKLPHLERQADTLVILSSSSSSSSSSGHHHHQGSSSSHHLQQGQDYRYTQVPSAGTSALQILSGGGGSSGGKRHKDGGNVGGSCVGGGFNHQTLHNTHIYLTPATRSYTHPHRSPLQPPPASSSGGHHHHHHHGGGARGSNNSSSFRTNASSHSSRSVGNFSSSSSSVSRATGEALTLAKCLRKHKEKQQKIHEQALTRKSKSDNALQKIGVNLKSQSDQNLHKVWLVGAGGGQASSCCTTNNSIFSTVQLSGGSGDSTASVASNNSSSSYKKRRRRLLAGIGLEEEIRRREQQQEEREERSRSLERNHGNRIHSTSNTRRHTRSLERNHKFRIDLRNLIPSPPLCPHIDPTPPDHPAPSPPTHAIPFLPSSTSHPSSHSFHSSSNSPSLPSYSSSSHSSSNTYSPTPHDTFSSTAHPRLGTIAAAAHSPFQSSLASAHSSFHSSLASAHSSHSSGSSGSGGFLPSSSSLEGRLCCTAAMEATTFASTNTANALPGAPGGSSFINKPARGWLHSDTQLAETGVTYGVRYIGCLEVKTSMKSLNFDTRSLIAKECISRVCEAAGLKTVDRRRKVVKAIGRILGESPLMQHAGSNVNLTITSTALCLSLLDSGVLIAHHDMPNISFASGGDPDTLDFIAYVAKDCLYGRACFVLECGGGQAQNVITSIGQAFEMRFKEYLKKTPQPSSLSPAGVGAVGAVTGGAINASLINNVNAPPSGLTAPAQPAGATAQTHNNNLNAPSATAAQPSVNYTTVNNPDRLGCPRNDDPEYYNDLPGKVPPDLIPPVSQPPPVPPLPNYNSSTAQPAQHSNINMSNNGSSNNLSTTGADVTSESLDEVAKPSYVACPLPLTDAPRPPSAASAGTNLIDLCGDAVSPTPSSTASQAAAPLRCEPEYANVPLSKQGNEGAAAAPKDPFDMKPFTAPLSQAEPSSTAPKCLPAQQRRDLQQESWYHGPITRLQAEKLLKQDGDFLVRESLNTSGQYVLTGVQNNTPKHLLLIDPNGAIRTKCQTFSSVSHLINYHRDNELPIVSNESALVLRSPVIRQSTPPLPR